jgi:adenine-specific DNA-methyltransferase
MTSCQLDRYYTPDHIAGALADWAISSPSDHLLDPSFGGCAFFRMGAATLAKRGARQPFRQLHGVDIDPEAKRYLQPLLQKGARENNFLFSDFLGITPQALQRSSFEVVFGNPPYVRHHRFLDRRQVDHVDADMTIPRTAGLWAYFVLHGLSFVRRGGTMAMLIPGAILEAEYASTLLRTLERSFSALHLVLLSERVFANAEATTMLLLARGRSAGTSCARVGLCETSAALPEFLSSLEENTRPIEENTPYRSELLRIAGHTRAVRVQNVLQNLGTITLGEVSDTTLGTVTGSNQTFLISDEQRRRLIGHTRWTIPALPNAKATTGLEVTREDIQSLATRGKSSLLLTIPALAEVSPELAAHLRQAEAAGVHMRTKCAMREPWYVLSQVRQPDAFLPYMSHRRLRLVLNTGGATSTNAIHHVTWRKEVTASERRAYVFQSLGAIFQLAAELRGKVYGGGVLKLELKPARSLLLFKPSRRSLVDLDGRFALVDTYLRSGHVAKAASLVDSWLVEHFVSANTLGDCRRALKFLRGIRTGLGSKPITGG